MLPDPDSGGRAPLDHWVPLLTGYWPFHLAWPLSLLTWPRFLRPQLPVCDLYADVCHTGIPGVALWHFQNYLITSCTNQSPELGGIKSNPLSIVISYILGLSGHSWASLTRGFSGAIVKQAGTVPKASSLRLIPLAASVVRQLGPCVPGHPAHISDPIGAVPACVGLPGCQVTGSK